MFTPFLPFSSTVETASREYIFIRVTTCTYNGVARFRDFGSKDVPKIRGLKLEEFLLQYFIDFIRSTSLPIHFRMTRLNGFTSRCINRK